MIKKLTLSLFLGFSSVSFASQISFGIDCMIHDSKGKMLADLGMLGEMMGQFTEKTDFTYGNLKIAASLQGPFTEAPEVSSPQLKLTVVDSTGKVQAALVTQANPDLNTALLVPSENLYLHCTKMDMD